MPFEKSLFGRLATGGLDIDPELRATADRVTAEGPRQGVANAVGLLDPGIIPVIEEGPTPFNLGMLALGTGLPGSGKIVGLGARIAAKKRKQLQESLSKIRGINATKPRLETQYKEALQNKMQFEDANPFELGMTPNQLRKSAEEAATRHSALRDATKAQSDEWLDFWENFRQMPEESRVALRDIANEGVEEAAANLDLIRRAKAGDPMAVKGLESLGFRTAEDFVRFAEEQKAIIDTSVELRLADEILKLKAAKGTAAVAARTPDIATRGTTMFHGGADLAGKRPSLGFSGRGEPSNTRPLGPGFYGTSSEEGAKQYTKYADRGKVSQFEIADDAVLYPMGSAFNDFSPEYQAVIRERTKRATDQMVEAGILKKGQHFLDGPLTRSDAPRRQRELAVNILAENGIHGAMQKMPDGSIEYAIYDTTKLR